MSETQIPEVLDAATAVDEAEDEAVYAARVVDFLALVHDYSANLIRLLARVGEDNAKASLSEAQADTSAATADGYRELAEDIRVSTGEVVDPSA